MSKLPNVVQLFECSKRQITFSINVFLFNISVRPLLLQFALQASWSTFYLIAKGRRQKKWYFWVVGAVDAEAFKACKNTIKLISLCALPCLGLLHT